MTGTNGKTTTAFLLYSILAAAGRRPGLLGTIESRVGGERRAGRCARRPRRSTSSALFREMLDAGDRSCAMEASSHGSELRRLVGIALRRARLHEPDARITSTSTGRSRRTSTPSAGSSSSRTWTGAGRPPRSTSAIRYGRRLAEELRGLGDEPAHVRARRRRRRARGRARADRAAARASRVGGTRDRDEAARPLQRRERPRRGRGRPRCSASTTTRSRRGVEHVPGVPGPLRGGGRGPAVRRARRLRAHARGARERPRARRAAHRRARSSASSGAAATATGRSAR